MIGFGGFTSRSTRLGEWLRWQPGRQGGAYRKMLLARVDMRRIFRMSLVGADAWLLHFRAGEPLARHLDPVPLARHFRVNLVLRRGGSRFDGRSLCRVGERLIVFRPDRHMHGVIPGPGPRVVLSVGWAVRP